MSNDWSKDHVKPEQRVHLRRAEDRNQLLYDTNIRWGHIATFLLVVVIMWLSIPPMMEDYFAKIDAERAGRLAGEVVHKLRLNCGI